MANGLNLKKNKKVLTNSCGYDIIITEREVMNMIKTVKYGELVVVECNVIRMPFDTWVDSLMDSEGNWYDIYVLADDGSLVAVLDETLED